MNFTGKLDLTSWRRDIKGFVSERIFATEKHKTPLSVGRMTSLSHDRKASASGNQKAALSPSSLTMKTPCSFVFLRRPTSDVATQTNSVYIIPGSQQMNNEYWKDAADEVSSSSPWTSTSTSVPSLTSLVSTTGRARLNSLSLADSSPMACQTYSNTASTACPPSADNQPNTCPAMGDNARKARLSNFDMGPKAYPLAEPVYEPLQFTNRYGYNDGVIMHGSFSPLHRDAEPFERYTADKYGSVIRDRKPATNV